MPDEAGDQHIVPSEEELEVYYDPAADHSGGITKKILLDAFKIMAGGKVLLHGGPQHTPKAELLEFFACEVAGDSTGHAAPIELPVESPPPDHMVYSPVPTLPFMFIGEMFESEGSRDCDVDIAFWYYRATFLVYSIRRVADNFFYDFASKRFAMLPVSGRAGVPADGRVMAQPGHLYHTRLSGKLDDGEYVVTFRDTDADDVVVGIMAVFIEDGIQAAAPPQGLEDTPVEEGLPAPGGTVKRRLARRVRPVDI